MALTADTPFTAYAGFDASFEFDFSDVSGFDAVNLVGKTALFTAKANMADADSAAKLSHMAVITSDDLDPTNSKVLVITFPASTMEDVPAGDYYFDLKLFNQDGTGLAYVPKQTLVVSDDVTNAIGLPA